MRQFNLLFAFLFFVVLANGQTFEGRIVYYVDCVRNEAYKKDSSILFNLGTEETLYIKNGNYLIKGNGKIREWLLYKSLTNKIYEKHRNSDTLFVRNASTNNNPITKTFHYKRQGESSVIDNKTGKVLWKLKLDEYVFETPNGTEWFRYNKKYKIDAKLYANHKYQHFGDFAVLSNCIPIDWNFIIGQYTFQKNATDFFPENLNDSIFDIPGNLILKESNH